MVLTSGIKELLIGAFNWFLGDILQTPMSGAVFSCWACGRREKTKKKQKTFRLEMTGRVTPLITELTGQSDHAFILYSIQYTVFFFCSFSFCCSVDNCEDLQGKVRVKASSGDRWFLKPFPEGEKHKWSLSLNGVIVREIFRL